MDTLLKDIHYGLRTLRKSPGVSIVATIALALGIGANTAIFSVVNAVLLRPLPFPNPEQLMTLWESDQTHGVIRGSYSYPNFTDLRDQNHVFDQVASFHQSDSVVTGRGEPERLQGAVVTANMFQVLGVAPMIGRPFLPPEDKPGDTGRVVMLSQALFQRRFGSGASILNKPLTMDGKDYTIVGVMPASFEFPIQNEPVEFWTTIAGDASGSDPITAHRGAHFLGVLGRLKSGVSQEQAQAEVNTIAARLEQQYPDTNTHKSITLEPALVALVGDVRRPLLILLGAVACVLLIACANVANLLLARAMTRHKEMAIRSALGASRMRVIRQLLTESVILSLAGGALGLLLAVWWSDLLVALGKENIPRALHVGVDWRVLGFTLGVSFLTGIVFGLVPAIHSSRTQLTESLKEGGRGSGEGARRNRIRGLLVISELAVAVVLLVGAGLLLQSLWRLRGVSPGLNSHNVLTFTVALPEVKYDPEKQSRFYEDLAAHLQSLPGVQSASAGVPLPLSGDRIGISFQIDGRPVARKDEPSADFFAVAAGYFRTMGIPIIKGRDFNDRDQHKSTPVIIITETFARRFFPGEDPIGKRVQPGLNTFEGEHAPMREIVGVVADVRNRSLDVAPKPAYYVPQTQTPFNEMTVVVRTAGDPQALVSAATKEVGSLDRDLPVFNVKTMDEYLASSIAGPRFNSTLLSIFASVALALTIVGLYGVMSYSVAQRTNEIGIRMALGAQTRNVLGLIIRQGLALVLIGLVIGLSGAFMTARVITSLLFGVTTHDALTFVAVPVLLGLVALLACYLPARRAARVDPTEALRHD